jgi:hypothetical protein
MDATTEVYIAYGRLLRLIQTGQIRGTRVEKSWFVDLEDLRRWKREQQSDDITRSTSDTPSDE